MRAVSLFSNCGAGDLGYHEAGFRFDVMAELDPRRLEVCLLNHPEADGVPGDLRTTWPEVVKRYREKAGRMRPALLAACPPCQGMSSARSGRGLGDDADAGSKDARNLLVVVIAKVAKALQPQFIVVENVPQFLTRKIRHPETNEPVSAASLLVSLLADKYQVFPILTDLADYGVPQTRKRTFLTFIRRNIINLHTITARGVAPYPKPTHALDHGGPGPVILRDALEELELPSLDAQSAQQAISAIGDGLHTIPIWPEQRYAMVAAIPPNSGASAWENNSCKQCGVVSVGEEDVLCPVCNEPLLRPVVQNNDGTYRFVTGFRSSSYRRMSPERPAATITTASGHLGSDLTIHPFENRVLSTLECARLQTFPTNFKWGGALKKWGHTNIRDMIGEAVPPRFTELHGNVLIEILSRRLTMDLMAITDPRYRNASNKLKSPRIQQMTLDVEAALSPTL
jgi:DNA (cytosine-5)-methyltransferase 1